MWAPLLAFGLWFSPPARAWEVDAVAADGALLEGAVGWVWIAVQDDQGRPVSSEPVVRSADAVVVPLHVQAAPGVFGFSVAPAPGERAVGLRVEHEGRDRSISVPVEAAPQPRWSAPEVVVAELSEEEVTFLVRGDDLPPPEALDVRSERARLIGVTAEPDGLRVRLAPAPSEDGFPRAWLVAVRDTRGLAPPQWVRVRQRSRLAVRAGGLEPGSQVWVSVGARSYGPDVADASGAVAVLIDHYPGEVEGRVRVVDPAGNEASRPTQLPGENQTLLMGVVAGSREQGEAPPSVYVRADTSRGGPWRRDPPLCRAPRFGDLPVFELGAGIWRVQVPYVPPSASVELRVQCDLDDASTSLSLPVAAEVPVGIELKVWPEELTADFPVADVRVSLHNAVGERVPFAGKLMLDAALGSLRVLDAEGPVRRAEYRGGLSAEVGEDIVEARWYQSAGAGPVDRLRLTTAAMPVAGELQVWVRAEDANRRPLPGREVAIEAGDRTMVTETGAGGWAHVLLPLLAGERPVRISARSEGRRRQIVLVRGTEVSAGVPGGPDLFASVTLPVTVGRVAEVELSATPAQLKPGRGETSIVTARFVDRTGHLADAAAPEVTSSEGELRPLEADVDGTMRWELVPRPSFRTRTIEIRARSEALDVEESVGVELRSPAANAIVGVSAGVQSNFAALLSPRLELSGDFRVRFGRQDGQPLGPSRFFVRSAVAWYSAAGSAGGDGIEGRKQTSFFPISVVLMLRQEYPAHAFWVGLGGQLVPYWGATSFDGVVVDRGGGVLPPALVLAAGYGLRVPGGEVVLEVQGSTLSSPGDRRAVAGFVGGVAVGLGYRLVF